MSWAFQELRLFYLRTSEFLGTEEAKVPLSKFTGERGAILTQQDQIPMLLGDISLRRVQLSPLGESLGHIPDHERLLKNQTHLCSPRDLLPEAFGKISN